MIRNYHTLRPFRFWCQKVLPLVYDDSLSYYELLCKVVAYLNNTREDLSYFITNWSTPEVVTDYNDFVNTNKIYLYMGDQEGYYPKHWYYYNPTTNQWEDGGEYGVADISDDMIYVTPQMFGGKGDGFTDDTEAIRSAIADGRPVVFPQGTYVVNGQLTLRSNLDVLGIDATLRFTDMETTWLIGGSNLSKINIQGMKFNFDEQTNLKYGISLLTCNDIDVVDCEFKNGFGYAVRINDNTNVLFDGCYFHNITGAATNPGGGIYGQNVVNLEVRNCKAVHLGDHAVYVVGIGDAYNINIHDNMFDYCGENRVTSGAAIVLYGNTFDSSVVGNKITNSLTGIQISDYGGVSNVPHDISVVANNMSDIEQNGITIQGLSNESCEGITVADCTLRAIGQDGILLRYARNCKVSGCSLKTITRYGVNCDYADKNVISNCTVEDVGETGVILGSASACNSNIVIGITLTNSGDTGTGIYVRTGESNIVCACVGTGFNLNVVNSGTDTIIINKTAIDGKWTAYAEKQIFSELSVSYTPLRDGIVCASQRVSDTSRINVISVTDTTISETTAYVAVPNGIDRIGCTFPVKAGHTYTIIRTDSGYSLNLFFNTLY